MLGRKYIPSAIKTKAACAFETSGINSDMLRKIPKHRKPQDEELFPRIPIKRTTIDRYGIFP
jgi:hypothetical protein